MDLAIRNATIIVGTGAPARLGDVGITDGRIVAEGAPGSGAVPPADTEVDATGLMLTPGFVDPHTHAIFAGDRRAELRRRLAGATYAQIAAEGGGRFVADDELRATVEECESVNDGEPITVFEITTAAGLLLFSRHPADVLLLEVGLGGLPVADPRPGRLRELEVAGDEVGVEVRVEHSDDPQTMRRCVGEVLLDQIVALDRLVVAEDARRHRPLEPGRVRLAPDVMMRIDDHCWSQLRAGLAPALRAASM